MTNEEKWAMVDLLDRMIDRLVYKDGGTLTEEDLRQIRGEYMDEIQRSPDDE